LPREIWIGCGRNANDNRRIIPDGRRRVGFAQPALSVQAIRARPNDMTGEVTSD